MRLLLDEQFPLDFARELSAPAVLHVHSLGWAGVKNGELLRRAGGVCDVFVTLDRSLQFQQNLRALPFGIVVVRATSNRLLDLSPHAFAIVDAAGRVKRGQVVVVGV
jgi:predicted nuclease of predicted toxin-antitoxin system